MARQEKVCVCVILCVHDSTCVIVCNFVCDYVYMCMIVCVIVCVIVCICDCVYVWLCMCVIMHVCDCVCVILCVWDCVYVPLCTCVIVCVILEDLKHHHSNTRPSHCLPGVKWTRTLVCKRNSHPACPHGSCSSMLCRPVASQKLRELRGCVRVAEILTGHQPI